ncbi:MAG: PmoA family protein [Pirellulales bacterium]|nr:PmoA family protein [Pirellulales bacterium]
MKTSSTLLFALIAVVVAVCNTASASAHEFTVEKKDGTVDVKLDGKLFTTYHERFQNKPVLHPIIGPTGKEMTRPLKGKGDHPHHSSLWFTHGKVNGLDFWHKKGLIEHQEYVEVKGGEQATIKTKAGWKDAKGDEFATEDRTMTFGADKDARWIDIDITFTASKPVTFGKTKEGAFAVRMWPESTVRTGGTILNSEGDKNDKAWSKPAAWVDYHGPNQGEKLGIAIMTHPTSFRFPTPWHVRTYGLFASNPFMKEELKLKPGDSFDLRYRFVFHKGTTEEAKIANKYKEFAAKKY